MMLLSVLKNKGVPYKEMVSRVQEALSFVGMMDFKDREPARLSGGQKQRGGYCWNYCHETIYFDFG